MRWGVIMIIGISREDLKKLRAGRKKKEDVRPRKRRTTVLSKKAKEKTLKQFEKVDAGNSKNNIVVDPHVKMNDNFMRTGWYKPIRKK